jgi:hypothetical protein
MSARTHAARKASAPTSADKAPIPAPAATHDGAPAPDVAAQLEGSARGHSFAGVDVSAAPLGAIQPKLTVGAPDDKYEAEADRVAGQVMRLPDSAIQRVTPEEEEDKIQAKPDIQRVTPEDDEDKIQTKPDVQRKAEGSFDAGAAAESRIAARRGGGSPLPDSTRAFMEPRFGADFGGVRVHADSEADAISQDLSARAFTTGSDIYFRQGEYRPSSSGGQELLAHELTHVVQQSNWRRLPPQGLNQETASDRSIRRRGGGDASNKQGLSTHRSSPPSELVPIIKAVGEAIKAETPNITAEQREALQKLYRLLTQHLAGTAPGVGTEGTEGTLSLPQQSVKLSTLISHILDINAAPYFESIDIALSRTFLKANEDTLFSILFEHKSDSRALTGEHTLGSSAIAMWALPPSQRPEHILHSLETSMYDAELMELISELLDSEKLKMISSSLIADLATREFNRTGRDKQKARARVEAIGSGFQWAKLAAQSKAREVANVRENELAKDNDNNHKAALAKITSKLKGTSKAALEKANQKYNKSAEKKEINAQYETRLENSKTARLRDEQKYEQQYQRFIVEMTDDGMDFSLIEDLLKFAHNDLESVRALRKVLLVQDNTSDLSLVKSLSKSKEDLTKRALLCEMLISQGVETGKTLILIPYFAEKSFQGARNILKEIALTASKDDLEFCCEYLLKYKRQLPSVVQIFETTIDRNCLDDLEGVLSINPMAVSFILVYFNNPTFNPLIACFSKKKRKEDSVRNIFNNNPNNAIISEIQILDWLSVYSDDVLLDAFTMITNQNWDVSVDLIDLMLSVKVLQTSKIQLKYLVRLAALAANGGLGAMQVFQVDINYAGTQSGLQRTGFLEFIFSNNDRAEIHTHWNTSSGQMTSMHIQDTAGQNGIEINNYTFVEKLAQCIVDAHNNAQPNLRPHTGIDNNQLITTKDLTLAKK